MSKVFLSGIAGTGMSALAGLFQQSGWQVSGSDVRFYPPVGDILARMGVRLHTGYAAENIPPDADLHVIGNVISRGNPEAETILNRGLEYCSMAEALYQQFIRGKKSVVVAGTHGKTTVASFVSYMLHRAGLEPGFFIGGKPVDFPENSRVAKGDYFVSEGDEYETAFFDRSPKFLKYRPRILILTALEHDHLDIYADEVSYLKCFKNLADLVPGEGLIIANGDDPPVRRVLASALTPVLYYGEGEAHFRISGVCNAGSGYRFKLQRAAESWQFATAQPGRYNVANLTAGIVLGLTLGIPPDLLIQAAAGFGGVERRLRCIRHKGGTVFYEDFAHHPTAIAAALGSLREQHPGSRIIAVFEPRSWSLRRNFFQRRLAASFAAADEIVIQDVFDKEKIPARERLDIGSIRAELEAAGKTVHLFSGYDEVKSWLGMLDCGPSQVVGILSNGDFGGLPLFVREME